MDKFKLSDIKNLIDNDTDYNNRHLSIGNKKIEICADNDSEYLYNDYMTFKDFMLAGYTKNYNLNETTLKDKPDTLHDLHNELNDAYDIFCIQPLYMYEHGAMYLSINDFNDRWDSGQVGYVFMTDQQAKERGINDVNEATLFIKNGIEYINKINNDSLYAVYLIDTKKCNCCNNVEEISNEYKGSYFCDDLLSGIIDAVGIDNIDMNA